MKVTTGSIIGAGVLAAAAAWLGASCVRRHRSRKRSTHVCSACLAAKVPAYRFPLPRRVRGLYPDGDELGDREWRILAAIAEDIKQTGERP